MEWGGLTQLLLPGIILKHCILTLDLTYLPSRHKLLRTKTYPSLVQIFCLDMIQLTFNGKGIVYCAPLKIQVAVATNFKWINCTKQFKGYWIGTAVNKLKSLSTTCKHFSKKNVKVSQPVAVWKSPSSMNQQHYIEIKISHWNEFKKNKTIKCVIFLNILNR